MLIENITKLWHDACHIWKYYIIKCYKLHVIFTYNDRHLSHFYENDTILLFLRLLKFNKCMGPMYIFFDHIFHP